MESRTVQRGEDWYVAVGFSRDEIGLVTSGRHCTFDAPINGKNQSVSIVCAKESTMTGVGMLASGSRYQFLVSRQQLDSIAKNPMAIDLHSDRGIHVLLFCTNNCRLSDVVEVRIGR